MGFSLVSVMGVYFKIFNIMFVSMIYVGENIGCLEDVFLKLIFYIEMEWDICNWMI